MTKTDNGNAIAKIQLWMAAANFDQVEEACVPIRRHSGYFKIKNSFYGQKSLIYLLPTLTFAM